MVESLQVLLRYHTKALLNTVCVQLALNTVSNYFSWHPKRQRSRCGRKGGGVLERKPNIGQILESGLISCGGDLASHGQLASETQCQNDNEKIHFLFPTF